MYTVKLAPADGKQVLYIARRFCVMRKLIMVLVSQMFRVKTEVKKEIPSSFFEVVVVLAVRTFFAEQIQ